MTHTQSHERQLEDLLTTVTDALMTERPRLDTLLARSDLPRSEIDPLVRLIQQLNGVMQPQTASDRFVRRLKTELLGQPQTSVVTRMRRLPARVQLAAAFALLAGSGVMLIFRRRLPGLASLASTEEEHGEVALLQQ